MSPVTPDTPSRPDSWSRTSRRRRVHPTVAQQRRSTPGSTEPERVPIARPSSGVKPIDVATDAPCQTAVTEQPLPRWATTMPALTPAEPSRRRGLANRPRHRQAVEAEAAHAPVRVHDHGQRIDVRGRRQRRVKRRVEDGHAGTAGSNAPLRADRVDRDRVVQRRELGNGRRAPREPLVVPASARRNACRRGRRDAPRRRTIGGPGPALSASLAPSVGRARVVASEPQSACALASGSRSANSITLDLERARARVDDEDARHPEPAQRPSRSQYGQVQPEISAGPRRTRARAYAAAVRRASTICWRSPPPARPALGRGRSRRSRGGSDRGRCAGSCRTAS